MRLHFLGTASGLPTSVRFSQTTVIEVDTSTLYILDVGDGASSLMCRQGLAHEAVRGIVISHMHGDHYCGIIQLLKTMMHLGRRTPLDVYLPSEGIEPLQTMLEASYLVPELFGFAVRWIAIDPTRLVRLGADAEVGPEIRPVANTHLDHYRARAEQLQLKVPWKFESYSFLITLGGLSIAYSGNLDRALSEMDPYARGMDVLIAEMAHLRPLECLEALGVLRPKHAFFSHFHREWDSRDRWSAGGLDRLAEGIAGVQVWITEDQQTFTIQADDGRCVVRVA